MLRCGRLGGPVEQHLGEIVNFILRQAHSIALRVVHDAKALALRVWRGNVTRSTRKTKTEGFCQSKCGFELYGGEGFTLHADEIVNVPLRQVFSALTVKVASAGDSGIEGTWKRGYTCPEEIYHSPYNSLCCKGCGAVSER